MFPLYEEISSFMNVLIDQRGSSCCTWSDGKPNNNKRYEHISAKVFSARKGSLTQNRQKANLVSRNYVFVHLGHGSMYRDAI